MEKPEELRNYLNTYFDEQGQKRDEKKKEIEFNKEKEKNPHENMLEIQRNFTSTLFRFFVANSELQEAMKESKDFDVMYDKLEELKTYFTNANYSMNSYDRQKYKEKIEGMEEQLGTLKANSQPKKKFAFSSRPKPKEKNASSGVAGNSQINSNELELEGIRFQRNEKIVIDVSKSSFEIKGNEGCTIEIQALANCIYMSGNRNCIIRIGAVRNSVLIDDCHSCTFELLTHQLRIHKTEKCDFHIFASSKPIIENCSELTFSKHRFDYDGLEEDLKNSGLKDKENLFEEVQDFNWLKTEKSPNFVIVKSSDPPL